MIDLLHTDCMEYMATQPDNAFDLAIVDPPYGVDRFSKPGSAMKNYGKMQAWDKRPDDLYFSELMRVSIDQIIWGYNNFQLPLGGHFIFWHKLDAAPSFSSGELAWGSMKKPAAYWSSATEKQKIHPTQKPVKLYQWILQNYAKPWQRVLDTHLGSGSNALAAYYFGCDFVGCEIDEDYYKAAVERFTNETKQQAMF